MVAMRRASALLLGVISFAAIAQQPPAPAPASAQAAACYHDKGVDAYIAELRKRGKGTGNPLPNNICIFGWCSNPGMGPEEDKEKREPAPEPEAKPRLSTRPGPNESSSKQETAAVRDTIPAQLETYNPLRAAHDADVGDYYFKEKNYRGALMRYRDALEQKPGDAALHLRIGRAAEKLGDSEQAFLAYDAALKLEPEGPGAGEARAGRERTAAALAKDSLDPEVLARDNQPRPAPCVAPPRSR